VGIKCAGRIDKRPRAGHYGDDAAHFFEGAPHHQSIHQAEQLIDAAVNGITTESTKSCKNFQKRDLLRQQAFFILDSIFEFLNDSHKSFLIDSHWGVLCLGGVCELLTNAIFLVPYLFYIHTNDRIIIKPCKGMHCYFLLRSITLMKYVPSLLNSQSNGCALFHANPGFKERANTRIIITRMIPDFGIWGITRFCSFFPPLMLDFSSATHNGLSSNPFEVSFPTISSLFLC